VSFVKVSKCQDFVANLLSQVNMNVLMVQNSLRLQSVVTAIFVLYENNVHISYMFDR
jgi:hypothetical protein